MTPTPAKLAQTVKLVDLGRRNIYRLDHTTSRLASVLRIGCSKMTAFVSRTGYGVFYNFLYLNSGGLSVGRNYPFKITQVFNANATRPNITIDDPFPAGLGTATISPVSIRRDFRTGYVHQYSLGFQYQPLTDFVVDVSYVGNKSTKLDRGVNINQPFHRRSEPLLPPPFPHIRQHQLYRTGDQRAFRFRR